MDEAASVSGLTDWGDPGFTAALELLVESCRATARLTPSGWDVLRRVLLRHLRNRLYLHAHVSAHPELAGRPIGPGPVVVTGLPRTGTTLLHNLLAQDPGNRVLRVWEALRPLPPGGVGATEEELAARAEVWLERLYAMTPGFRAIHGATAKGPEECDVLLQNSFASQHFDDMFRADAYSEWLNGSDLTEEYAYHALQLRVLAGPTEDGRAWVLKSPSHLGYLGTVLATFPGARVVLCHRQPVEAVASYASLVAAVRAPHTDQVTPAEAGRHALRRCSIAMARAMAARDGEGDDRFLDIRYTDLVGQPLAAVQRIYAWLGRPLPSAAEAAMGAWLRTHPQHGAGRHRYDPSVYGVGPREVSAALGPYLERFFPPGDGEVPRS